MNNLTGKEMGLEAGKEQKTKCSAVRGSVSVCPLVVSIYFLLKTRSVQWVCLGFVWFVSKQSPALVQRLSYEGGSGADSGGIRWWFPLEGTEKTGAAERQMRS